MFLEHLQSLVVELRQTFQHLALLQRLQELLVSPQCIYYENLKLPSETRELDSPGETQNALYQPRHNWCTSLAALLTHAGMFYFLLSL